MVAMAPDSDQRNVAVLSQHVYQADEPDCLKNLRRCSQALNVQACQTVSYLQGFLQSGGPEAIKSLKGTIKKLQLELEEEKGCGQVKRYRALQQDLKQRDAVCAALRCLLTVKFGMGDAAIDERLDAKVLKLDCLYGASREHLLRENKALRSAVESRLITAKTLAPSPQVHHLRPTSGTFKETKDSRTPVEGVQHLDALMNAVQRLDAAEKAFAQPIMCTVSTQTDDGTYSHIRVLETQVQTLAEQKAQLLRKLSESASALSIWERRTEAAENEAANAQRQKTELMYHQGDMSKEVRNHLKSEAARAERAELIAAEASRAMQAAKEAEAGARAEVALMRTVLVDKEAQVQQLHSQQESMKTALLSAMDGLVQAQSSQQDAASVVADQVKAANKATERQLTSAIALLQDVCRAAADSMNQTSSLAAQQKEMVEKFEGERQLALQAMAALEAQLHNAHEANSHVGQERRQLQYQIIASSLLGRHQDRRHDEALKVLRRSQASPTRAALPTSAPASHTTHSAPAPVNPDALAETAMSSSSYSGAPASSAAMQPLPKLRRDRPWNAPAQPGPPPAAQQLSQQSSTFAIQLSAPPAAQQPSLQASTPQAPAQHPAQQTSAPALQRPALPAAAAYQHTQGPALCDDGIAPPTHVSSQWGSVSPKSPGGHQHIQGPVLDGTTPPMQGSSQGPDPMGDATGAVLQKSAALRVALEVLASASHPATSEGDADGGGLPTATQQAPHARSTAKPDAIAWVGLRGPA